MRYPGAFDRLRECGRKGWRVAGDTHCVKVGGNEAAIIEQSRAKQTAGWAKEATERSEHGPGEHAGPKHRQFASDDRFELEPVESVE